MTEGYFNYEHLENLLLKDKGKINDKTAQKFKLKLVNEKKPLDNTSNDKINKEPKNNINGKKDNGIVNVLKMIIIILLLMKYWPKKRQNY